MNLLSSILLINLLGGSGFSSVGKAPADNPSRINQLRNLKVVLLKAANSPVHAWIMDNESKRQEGMMFLKPGDVQENQGMIFVFASIEPRDHSFWMHNCPMGLDIIYIGKDHKVVNVGDGPPESDAQVLAKGDYKFVLELKRGWSKRHGLRRGALVSIPTTLTTKA